MSGELDYDSEYNKNITGSFTANAQTLDISGGNNGTKSIQVDGTFSGTIIVEVSDDGTVWTTLPVIQDGSSLPALSITTTGLFLVATTATSNVRLRSTTWSSGTANFNTYGSDAAAIVYANAFLKGGTDGTAIGNVTDKLKVDVSGSNPPVGAATAANQTTEITSLQILDDVPAAMNAPFVKGDTMMGQLDDVSTTAATEDNVAPVRITPQRAEHVNLRNQAGAEIGIAAAPIRTDPTGTTTQPVSAVSLPLPTGAATETTLAKLPVAQASTTSGQSGPLVQGAVTTAAPSYSNGQTDPLSLTPAGALRTDSSATTQPVSAASLPLPTGASTSANQSSELTLIGAVTETAPATDTASSGLNGRLQRIAQRLTSLIGLFPASVGQKASAASFPVVLSTEQEAEIGIVTETAPATDTASSGLNGRLQRIAQRLTSLIALIPSSVGIAWFSRISDGTDTALVTTNGEQKVVDGLRNGSVYGALNIPTANTAVEAKVGGARLANRKFLYITIENNGIFWGYDNTVTTTSGFPTANGQVLTWAIDPDSTFQIWLVGSANNKNVHVGETP